MSVPYAEVIGDPVAHSKSPLIHRFWLEKLGIEAGYIATQVAAGEMAKFLAERRCDPLWRGCNVTMPLKQEAFAHVEPLQPQLGRIGSVNCIVARKGTLHGANTDTDGVMEALVAAQVSGPGAAVIGAGGAARAACLTLSDHVSDLMVINRNVGRARRMVAELGIIADVQGLDAPIPSIGLLVNASPLGMQGYPPVPLSLDSLPSYASVIDIVYDPLATPLLAAAKARGLRTIDGLTMLIGQAAAAFALLFDRLAPREHDRALRALLES